MADDVKKYGGESFQELLEASWNLSSDQPQRGEIRQATILQISDHEIIVDMGAKRDGIVPAQDLERLDDEVRNHLNEGDKVYVYVINPQDMDGNLIVSINMGLQQQDWDRAKALLDTDDVVEVSVEGYNKGGILVRWNRLDGFIPSSHMISVSSGLQGEDRREAMEGISRTRLGVKVIEVDQSRRRLIFSEREAQREWRAQQKAKLLSELAEGDMVEGTVTGLRDFGAFVNIGGADGLIHVSELAWHRVDHPRDVLNVGDEIKVYVLSLDRKTNRIALSRKRLMNDPWEDVMGKYYEGQQVEGTVTNVVDFGAFIALDDGLEGLLHLSEMGDGSLKEPHSYVKKGDRLQLRISRLEPEKRRVGFTQRWGTDLPILAEGETPIDEAAPVATDPIEEIAPLEAEPEPEIQVEATPESEIQAEVAPEPEVPVEETPASEGSPEE